MTKPEDVETREIMREIQQRQDVWRSSEGMHDTRVGEGCLLHLNELEEWK